MDRVKEIVEKDFAGKIEFIAQNIKTQDFGDQVFKPYVMREMNGVPCAIIGQAFPYTPIANPRYMVADWEFGIQDENMQKTVDEVLRLLSFACFHLGCQIPSLQPYNAGWQWACREMLDQ